MPLLFKGNAWRAVELGNDDPFSAIDDKSPLVGHDGDRPHIDFFFFNPRLIGQTEFHFQGHIVCDASANTFFRRIFGNPEIIGEKFQDRFLIVRFDGKNFGKNFLKPNIFPLMGQKMRLQKLVIGLNLNFNQIRKIDNLFPLAKTHPVWGLF